MFDPLLTRLKFMPFHEIMPSVIAGEVAAGVIIHESRFTYQESGLVKLLDLGEWWEETTGFPIPLGGIVARRSLGREAIALLDRALADSVAHAFANPGAATAYIRSHAQEMSDEVCAAHISLYVNDFSVDMGAEGQKAVACLIERAEQAGVIPRSSNGIFVD
jgi:1,4-dihydroxy-6-naphthoate synthase